MPRIGLVCEGATDRAAIERYVRQSLISRGYSDVTFLEIPAHHDKTASVHGFAMVLAWLNQSPAERSRYLTDLFAGDNAQRCDAIVVHLDADNLSRSRFRKHVHRWYQTHLNNPVPPQHRGNEIARLIKRVGKFNSLQYVVAAAVESTETWCLSTFPVSGNPEKLSGQSLRQKFMEVLHLSEGRPTCGRVFSRTSKGRKRREKYCDRTAQHTNRIENQCHHYNKLVTDLCKVI